MSNFIIKNRLISELIPAEYNPRQLTDKQYKDIKTSLKKFGIVDPIIVNMHPNRQNIIIGGHMRSKIWHEMGNDTIPVFEVSLNEEDEKELNIRLNKNTGDWDYDVLANEFNMQDLIEWGFTDLSFFETDTNEAKEDGYEIPETIHTDIVIGDLIQIGSHRLLCGSCTEIDSWSKLMGTELADLMITDPPYNVNYTGKTKDKLTIKNDKQSDGDYYQFLYDFYTAAISFIKEGGSMYIWHSDLEGLNFRKALVDSGVKIRECLIWVKNTFVMGRQDYHCQHEPCLYGWKEGASHNWYGDRKQSTTLFYDKPNRNESHPTMKPIPLISYLISNSSKKGDLIIDPFGGSGTTMVASEQMKRKCYMMELDPKYCQIIIERMVKMDPSIEVKINGIKKKQNGQN